jgi:hypothetical protein
MIAYSLHLWNGPVKRIVCLICGFFMLFFCLGLILALENYVSLAVWVCIVCSFVMGIVLFIPAFKK